MPTAVKKNAAPTQAATERPFQRNALKKLTPEQLDREVRDCAKDWRVLTRMLTRKAQALERKRLLPAIEEVRRRIKAGKTVAGHRRIEAYIESLGLPPSLVRKWRFREQGKKTPGRVDMRSANARTRGGYYRKDITSLLHKSLRRGDESTALFAATELDLSGLRGHVVNTLIVTGSEDVGIADPDLTVQLLGLSKTLKSLQDEELAKRFFLDMVLRVVRARKSRVSDEALCPIYGNAIPEKDAEPLLVEVVRLDRDGSSGKAWNNLTLIARDADAAVAVQIHALHEHWKNRQGEAFEESDEGAVNRIFLIDAAIRASRAEKSHQNQQAYADRAKRKIPDYALDYHSRTGFEVLKRTKTSAEAVRHFLEEGAKLANEDTSISNLYRAHFEKWIWSKVKKAPGKAAPSQEKLQPRHA
jgi:hypothetical protein